MDGADSYRERIGEFGFCHTCMESIVPFEPRSADGLRHRYCDTIDAKPETCDNRADPEA